MSLFIVKYSVATIPFMPFTTLTNDEYARIEALMEFYLGNEGIWQTFKDGGLFTLTGDQRSSLAAVGSNWMSSYWSQYEN